MPNTYVALDTQTIGTATNSITFTNIPQGYTDLVLVTSVGSNNPVEIMVFQVGNSSVDTGSNYSTTYLLGNGSTASSGRFSNLTYGALDRNLGVTTTTGGLNTITNFMNYSNTTTNKTILSRANQVDATYNGTEAMVNLWRSTAAINTIKIFITNGVLFNVGSSFSLYGIANADQGAAKATGGMITEDSTYWYHTFGASGAFIPKQALTCDYLVIAGGGGGGGSNGGGGGGAGGYIALTSQSLTTTSYAVTVGAGGAVSTSGNDSVFNSSTALKGGRGGDSSTGGTGGSGTFGSGGGVGRDNGAGASGGAGTSGQGFAGGSVVAGQNGGGGGGGAGAVGNNALLTGSPGSDENSTSPNGNGGAGLNTWATWAATTETGVSGFYMGGGGGSAYQNVRNTVGGSGGGGQGSMRDNGSTGATAGVANTGSGGGGGGGVAFKSNGQPGGSGVVIVRYLKA